MPVTSHRLKIVLNSGLVNMLGPVGHLKLTSQHHHFKLTNTAYSQRTLLTRFLGPKYHIPLLWLNDKLFKMHCCTQNLEIIKQINLNLFYEKSEINSLRNDSTRSES